MMPTDGPEEDAVIRVAFEKSIFSFWHQLNKDKI